MLLASTLILLALGFDVAFPDTASGKIAAAYFAAFNSNDEAAYRGFEERNRAASSLAMRPMSERLEQYKKLRADWGELQPKRVQAGSDGAITVTARINSGAFFDYTFEFEKQAPGKLVAIRIEGPVEMADGTGADGLAADEIGPIIQKLSKLLEEQYVFPEKARAMADAMRTKAGSGGYHKIDSQAALARELSNDLQAVCNDKHLRVRVTPAGGGDEGHIRIPQDEAANNFGFERVEVLPGNIGLVKLNGFSANPNARQPAAAAMAFLGNCKAMIFDLRDNGGGSPEMIKFLQSYFFTENTHLNSFFDRNGEKVEESWTLDEVPGKRFAKELPVFVLTSSFTFSGAEEFAYNLQCRKRGVIVGETTGGGAHPVKPATINNRLMVTIPFMRANNPVTNKNWEGVGVVPDIATSRETALERACAEARRMTGGPQVGTAPAK